MSKAVIRWASGPVIRARTDDVFHSYEALAVGEAGLLGEVIQLSGDEIVAQVYEDTTGLRPGDPVTGTGAPLSVRLGPGLLGDVRVRPEVLRDRCSFLLSEWFAAGRRKE